MNGAPCGADGDLDVLYGITQGGANKIYENNGDGTFLTSNSMITSIGNNNPPGSNYIACIADFNGEYLSSHRPSLKRLLTVWPLFCARAFPTAHRRRCQRHDRVDAHVLRYSRGVVLQLAGGRASLLLQRL